VESIEISGVLRNNIGDTAPNVELIEIILKVRKVLCDSDLEHLAPVVKRRLYDPKN